MAIDDKERYSDPQEAMRAVLQGFRAGIWTALPGIIQSFDASKLTAVVLPAIQGTVTAPDGSTKNVPLPLLPDVPVCFPRGGGCTLTFPVAAGDECLVVFSSRCIDSWWQSGGAQVPFEPRMHDLSDGFALVGPFSQATKIAGFSTTKTQLRSNDGATYVELDPAGQVVKIKAPGGITLDTPLVTMTGNMTSQGNVLAAGSISDQNAAHGSMASMRATFNTHTHTDPQGGTVGPANPQTA